MGFWGLGSISKERRLGPFFPVLDFLFGRNRGGSVAQRTERCFGSSVCLRPAKTERTEVCGEPGQRRLRWGNVTVSLIRVKHVGVYVYENRAIGRPPSSTPDKKETSTKTH